MQLPLYSTSPLTESPPPLGASVAAVVAAVVSSELVDSLQAVKTRARTASSPINPLRMVLTFRYVLARTRLRRSALVLDVVLMYQSALFDREIEEFDARGGSPLARRRISSDTVPPHTISG